MGYAQGTEEIRIDLSNPMLLGRVGLYDILNLEPIQVDIGIDVRVMQDCGIALLATAMLEFQLVTQLNVLLFYPAPWPDSAMNYCQQVAES